MHLVNPKSLATFQELMEPDELRNFLDRVRQEVVQAAILIEQANAIQDWITLQKLAHRLKGSLGSVGCDSLHAVLDRLDMQLLDTAPQVPEPCQMAELSRIMALTAQQLLDI